jgi:hypothetical protein
VSGPTFAAAVRLPIAFDAEALAEEAATIPHAEWTPHFNTQQYEGDWSGVALRSGVGAPLALYPDPTSTEFVDTPLLSRLPRMRAALAQLACPLQTVRLLRVGPGSRILPHRDFRLGYDHGEVRLHVPLASDAAVQFFIDEGLVPMRPGECWYVDLDHMHRVTNDGDETRVHLVVDCVVNEWLTQMLRTGTVR